MAHMLLLWLWAYNDYFMRCGLIVQIKKENKKKRNGNFASLQTTQPCADNEISWADIEFPFSPGALLFPISIIVCFKSSLWQNLHAQEKGMLFITWRITCGESFDFFSCAVALFLWFGVLLLTPACVLTFEPHTLQFLNPPENLSSCSQIKM